MKLLSIVYADDGRKLKHITQWLIKSGSCTRVLVSNYVHNYTAGEGKSLSKTQHKLVQIHYEDGTKLTAMLDKLMGGWRENHWVCDVTAL